MKRRALMLAPLAITGCSLGPVFTRPEQTDPEIWRAGNQPAVWPGETWWRGFRSPELDGLIEAAIANNLDIAAAVARIREADAQVRQSGSALLPAVSLQGREAWARSGVQSRTTGRFSGRFAESRTATLQPSVSFEVDLWGRIEAMRDAAIANALSSRFDKQTVALSVVSSVASAWFQALALQDRLAVSARNIGDAEQILAAIRARAAVGTASQLDVAQQETLVAGLRVSPPGLRSQLEQQLNALALLTGRPPAAMEVRPGTLGALALPEVAPGLPSELLARRPDVASAEAQLMAANANIRAARANFFPTLDLTGSFGWQSLALGTLFGPGSFFANAAATGIQTVFDNGLRRAQLEQVRARQDELLANYRKAVLQAFVDVENGVQAYRFATEQEALERAAVATAQRAADIARAQLLTGTVDVVTALQAQNALFNNLDALAQIRLSRFQALLGLYKALGGGWSRADMVLPAFGLFQGVL